MDTKFTCELKVETSKAYVIFCDIISVSFLVKNGIQHIRTKYIDIDFHFIKKNILAKKLELNIHHLRSNLQT